MMPKSVLKNMTGGKKGKPAPAPKGGKMPMKGGKGKGC